MPYEQPCSSGLRRQSVDNRAIARILEDMQVTELARSAGLCLKHNCTHVWREDDSDWDQAVVCCTRYLPMTKAAAEVFRLAAEQARSSSRRPDNSEHVTLANTCHVLDLQGSNVSALTSPASELFTTMHHA